MIHGSLEDAMHSKESESCSREFLKQYIGSRHGSAGCSFASGRKASAEVGGVRRQASKQVVAPALPQSADGNDEDDDERMQGEDAEVRGCNGYCSVQGRSEEKCEQRR